MPQSGKAGFGSEFENEIGIKLESRRGYSIGQLVESVSKLTGSRCTPAMIYNYEKHGLILEAARSAGGSRLFCLQDIQRVVCIKRWQAQGLSLDQIKEKLDSCEDDFDINHNDFDLLVDRRDQILQAAATIFPQKGYAATTLQDIAQEAGISSSAIYQHFRSKEDLFLALTDNLSFIPILDQINRSLDENKDIGYEDVLDSLIDVGEGFLGSHMRNAAIFRMFIADSRSFPEVGIRYFERLVGPVEKLLMRYLSIQVNRGLLRPVNIELAVRSFYGIFLNLMIVQNIQSGGGPLHIPKRDQVKQLVEIFLLGIFNSEAGKDTSF